MVVPDNFTREEYVTYANLAGKGHRFGEMVECAKKLMAIAVLLRELTPEERNVIFKAYDGVIKQLRSSWKIYDFAEKNQHFCIIKEGQLISNNEYMKKIIKTFKSKVESEINSICSDIFHFCSSFETPPDLSHEMHLFLYKLKGDYKCYSAETKIGDERRIMLQNACESYERAEVIVENLDPSNPFKKGLAYSLIFYHLEMRDDVLAAWDVVVKATEEGVFSDFDPKGRDIYDRIRELYSTMEVTCPVYPSKLKK